MARVFISYRRADGQYAVGWLQERLRQMPQVTGVDIAFRDADLLCGDDYVSCLVRQVEACDVLIAVIGPNWHGRVDDSTPARILDPDDWVGREITTALAGEDTVIMPLLIDGAEPLAADDLLPEHAALARMHAVQFDNDVRLEEFVGNLKKQLERIDAQRALTRGLEKPIEIAPFHPTVPVWGLAVLAAVAIGGLRLFLGEEVQVVAASQYRWVGVLWLAIGAALAVHLGALVVQRLRPLVRIRSLPVLAGLAVAGLAMIWLSVVDENLFAEGPEGWRLLLVALSAPIVVPAAYIVLGVGWSEPVARRHQTGARVRLLAEQTRAVTTTAVLFALWATLGVWAPKDVEQRIFHLTAAGAASLIIIGAVIWARTRLERDSVALEADIAPLATTYQDNARAHLVTEPLATAQTWLVAVMVLPMVAGAIRMIWLPGL